MKLPTYRRHRGSGQAVMEFKGNRTYLGRYDSPESHRKYRALVAEILEAAGVEEDQPDFSDIRMVGELVIAFKAGAKSEMPLKEYQHFAYAAHHLFTTSAEILIRDFRPSDLEKARDAMVAAGWTRGHINRQVNRLRRIFKWGVRKSIVPAER